MKSVIYRPARIRGWAMLGLLLLVLAILSAMIWRNLSRLESLRSYVRYSHRIQMANLSMQSALLEHIADNQPIDVQRLAEIAEQVRELQTWDRHLHSDTPARLESVVQSLSDRETHGDSPLTSRTRLLRAMTQMNATLDEETDQRERMLEELSTDTRYELALASATLAAIVLFGGLFLRDRILAPLNSLRVLLLRLADQNFSPIETDQLDPLLLPVFTSFNDLVRHLSELEEAKRRYTESLENEVRAATRALLEQQRSLAEAERLAATGELAAIIAHELRNPLAGIQMGCANLRSEIEDPTHAQRLDLISSELKRMARLLNDLLQQSRQTPAPAKQVKLSPLVSELISLTRYQIPSHIRLHSDIPDHLTYRLADYELRQALLNLVLNAAQAIDGRPGEIVIAAAAMPDHIEITVTDDGPGFDPDLLKNPIRAFTTHRTHGTGLGLAIVQRFAQNKGGKMKLANVNPHGARVTLQLPVIETAQNE